MVVEEHLKQTGGAVVTCLQFTLVVVPVQCMSLLALYEFMRVNSA